jgi:hypothetical protein
MAAPVSPWLWCLVRRRNRHSLLGAVHATGNASC